MGKVKHPINLLVLQCGFCNTPSKQTPKNAILGDSIHCDNCGCELAFVTKKYDLKDSPIHWVLVTHDMEDETFYSFTAKILIDKQNDNQVINQ